MRVHLPATFAMLTALQRESRLGAAGGWAFAVTDELRRCCTEGLEEELLADIAFEDAAEASLRLLAAGGEERFPHRRVVVSADVPESAVRPRPDMGADVVALDPAEVTLADIAAIHVDVADSEPATARAVAMIARADLGEEEAELAVGDAQENLLAWYDPSELPFLVDLL